jgi:anti-sigma B factor antagonist
MEVNVIEESPLNLAPLTVAVTGEIDLATAPQLREAVETAFSFGAPEVLVDLAGTTFMDSSGLHVLIDAARRAAEQGRTLTIDCPPGNVRRVIDLAGVAELLPLADEAVV